MIRNYLLLLAMLIIATVSFAQTSSVKGKVTTADGKPAPFVNVQVKGQTKTVTTDGEGNFYLKNLPAGTYTIVVSHTGLQTQEKEVIVPTEKDFVLNVTLVESSNQLDEVVVNKTRTINHKPVNIGKVPIAPMDLPQAVTVIDAQLIADQQATRLSDVVKNVNGVYVSSTRGATQETFAARGYGFGNNNMFKNGFRVNSGAMPEVTGLEKVEVLKGSAAILYGNVAAGGIMNMVTKQPKFEKGGSVSFQTGSYDFYKPIFDVYGGITKNIAFRVDGTYEKAGSFRNNVKSEKFYVNPSLLFKLGNKTTLLVQGDYLRNKFTPDFGIGTIADTAIAPLGRKTFLGTPWQYATTEQYTSTISLGHEFSSNWRLDVAGSYQQYNRDYYAVERVQIRANGDFVRPLNRSFTKEDYVTGQANLTGKFKTGGVQHTLLTGVDADHYENQSYTYNNRTTYDTINIFNPNKYTTKTDIPTASRVSRTLTPSTRFGVYVQDLIKITAKLNLLAGLRWSYQKTNGAEVTNLLTNAQTTGNWREDKALSPRLGIVYKPTANTSVFASYSNSFSTNTGLGIDSGNLKPSIIDQYEIGIKNEFLNGLLSTNVTAYRIKNNNLSLLAAFDRNGNALPSTTTLRVLSGETTSDGVELDITGHPTKGLDITAGYSYNFSRYTKTDTTRGSVKTGERILGAPQNTYNATAFYTFTTFGIKGLKLGASIFYIGDRTAGFNNSVGQTQKFNRNIRVKGYTTADISLGYNFQHFNIIAKLANIGNTLNYNVHENYSVNPIAPRMFSATVGYRF